MVNKHDGATGALLSQRRWQETDKDYLGQKPIAPTLITAIDVPVGFGLDTPSALTVALIEAFVKLFNLPLRAYDIAAAAYDIERKDIGLLGVTISS